MSLSGIIKRLYSHDIWYGHQSRTRKPTWNTISRPNSLQSFFSWVPMFIVVQNYKIWCRTIQRCRISPWSTQIICGSVVDVMVCINNESACLWPSLPAARSNAMAQQDTSFVNANIIWVWFLCWIDCLQKPHNICGWFWLGKFCNNNSTWSTNCFNTVKLTRHKVCCILHFRCRLVMRLCTWLCSWVLR